MSIEYKLVQRRNPMAAEGEPQKYYVQTVMKGKKDLKALAETVARHTTMGLGDIHGVLISLEQEIAAAIKDGFQVELGDLCTFYPDLKSEGADNLEDFNTASHLTRKSVRIRAKKTLTHQMADVPVEKVD